MKARPSSPPPTRRKMKTKSAKGEVHWAPPYSKHPWRGVYLTYQLLSTAFVRFPLWLLHFSVPSNRQSHQWTLRRAVGQRLLKHLIYIVAKSGPLVRHTDYLAISTDEGVKGVWIPPTPELVTSQLQEWADAASVSCVRIPGYWIERNSSTSAVVPPPAPGEKVVYALHGGGYGRQSAHPRDPTSNIPLGLLKYTTSVRRCLTLEYRLSKLSPPRGSPPHPFPAALLDAIAGYRYLVEDVGFDPANIVVEGDSAGAHLALALVRYLVENQGHGDVKLPPPPGALVLNSPWADMSGSDHIPGKSPYTNEGKDYITIIVPYTMRVINAFLGPAGRMAAKTNPYISPAGQTPELQDTSFAGFPRTFITAGGCEVLRDQIRVLKDRMTRDLGKDAVVYHEMPEAVHDVLVFPWFEPERSEALQKIAAWIDV